MLLLAGEEQSWFADHADPTLRWALPGGLVAGREPDGTPRFAVVRHRADADGGGFLHVELRADGPAPAVAEAAAATGTALATVPFDRSRFRLVRWLSGVPGEAEPVGPWRETTPGGAVLAAASVALDALETQVLAAAVADDAGAGVEVEAGYRGVAPGLPAVAVVDADLLRARLAALGDGPVRADEVVAVLASLPTGPAVELLGSPVDRAAALERLGHHAVAELCERVDTDPWTPARLRVRPGAPEGARWFVDLAPIAARERRWAATWSVRDVLAGLTAAQRDRVFPAVPPFSPFARTDLLVTCAVPVDGAAVRRVEAVLRGTGPGGVPTSTTVIFDGNRTVTPLTLFRPVGTPAEVTLRTLTTLGPPATDPAGPARVVGTPARPVTGPLVDLTPAEAGIVAVRVTADRGVFTRAGSVEVTLGAARAVLDADRPDAVLADAAGAGPDLVATAVERGTARRAEILRRTPVHAVTVPAHAVEVLDADVVTVVLDAATTASWVALTVVDGAGTSRTRTLDPGVAVPWPCRRATVFDPLAHRHRVQHVPHAGGPLLTGPWTDATGPDLHLVVQPEE